MHHILRSVFTVLALLALTTAAHASAWRPFYLLEDASTRSKEAFIEKFERGAFRLPAAVVVDRMRHAFGVAFGSSADFVRFIRSDEVAVAACNWKEGDPRVQSEYVTTTERAGWDRRLAFGTISRPCRRGEYILTYRGKAAVSLACGNPLHDSREQVVIQPPPVAVKEVKPPQPEPTTKVTTCTPASASAARDAHESIFVGVQNSHSGPTTGFSFSPGFIKEETVHCQ